MREYTTLVLLNAHVAKIKKAKLMWEQKILIIVEFKTQIPDGSTEELLNSKQY